MGKMWLVRWIRSQKRKDELRKVTNVLAAQVFCQTQMAVDVFSVPLADEIFPAIPGLIVL